VLRGDRPADELRKEQYFARGDPRAIVGARAVAYHVEVAAGILPWPFAVMPYLHGTNHLGPEAKTGAAQIEIARGLGRAATALSQVRWPVCGYWDPGVDDVVGRAGSPGEWLTERTTEWVLRTARTSEPLDARSQALVDEHVAAATASLQRAGADFQPTLVHHDFRAGNTAMRRNADGTYDVTGVFDLQECYAGDPIEELARPLFDLNLHGTEVGAAFLLAYQAPIPLERLRAYVVVDRLVVWMYGRQPGINWFDADATFAGWMRDVLRGVDDAIAQYER
jgi:aminoglycoside phosphotransferase (APT) family kinase protein